MEFVVIDNCPVPAELGDEIQRIKEISGAHLNSCDRSPEAEPLLRQHGKHSQRELFDALPAARVRGEPGEPPGRSTHERRNDGVAYPGAVGEQLEYWQVGMDWDNPPAAIAAAQKLGWIATITYPNSPHEAQHVNFRKEPETGLADAEARRRRPRRAEDHTRAGNDPQPAQQPTVPPGGVPALRPEGDRGRGALPEGAPPAGERESRRRHCDAACGRLTSPRAKPAAGMTSGLRVGAAHRSFAWA